MISVLRLLYVVQTLCMQAVRSQSLFKVYITCTISNPNNEAKIYILQDETRRIKVRQIEIRHSETWQTETLRTEILHTEILHTEIRHSETRHTEIRTEIFPA